MSQSTPLPNLGPAQVEWLMITANCLLVQQDPEAALTLLEFLLCYEPGHQQALLMLAYCYHRCGRHDEALDSLGSLEAHFQNANPVILLLQSKALAALGREQEAGARLDAFSLTLEQAQ